MSKRSNIEWTDSTWNPVTGCSKISSGCLNCYAFRMANRLKAMGNSRYKNGFEVTLHPDLVELPLKWKKPRLVFVNSMSDLFHEKVPTDFILKIFDTMNKTPQHIYQILTKRSSRLTAIASHLKWSQNIWQGVSVEDSNYLYRIKNLKTTPAHVKFVSFEPLLGPIGSIDLTHLHWVIVGGESGPGARPIKPEWVREIRNRCLEHEIPFFFKQWGGVQKHRTGRMLDGRTWDQYPISQMAKKTYLNRLQKAVVLLNLIDMLGIKGSRCGETHIQKAVYFLQTMFNVPFNYQFVLYKYGPFSFDLSDELVRIRADGLLKSVPTPSFGVTFHLDEAANQLRAKFAKTGKRYEPIINLLTKEIGAKAVKELEKLATIQYIKVQSTKIQSPDAIADKLIELKPHIAKDEAQEAVIAFAGFKEKLQMV